MVRFFFTQRIGIQDEVLYERYLLQTIRLLPRIQKHQYRLRNLTFVGTLVLNPQTIRTHHRVLLDIDQVTILLEKIWVSVEQERKVLQERSCAPMNAMPPLAIAL